MKLTKISVQAKNQDRVNIFIDQVYFCSLELWQVVELKLKVGLEIDETKKTELLQASQFGKLYVRAVNKVFARPHSERQIGDYLRQRLFKLKIKDDQMINQIIERMKQNNYLDDVKFAQYWVTNRNLKKGISQKKLRQELIKAGIAQNIIDQVLKQNLRDEHEELRKVIAKKSHRYSDQQKLIKYLLGRGFNYQAIKQELTEKE